eukprot:4342166-Pyramimonas_sp.AAC.1
MEPIPAVVAVNPVALLERGLELGDRLLAQIYLGLRPSLALALPRPHALLHAIQVLSLDCDLLLQMVDQGFGAVLLAEAAMHLIGLTRCGATNTLHPHANFTQTTAHERNRPSETTRQYEPNSILDGS